MQDDDEITFDLRVYKQGKKLVLIIESGVPISNKEFIMSLESYLSDLIRANDQTEKKESLH